MPGFPLRKNLLGLLIFVGDGCLLLHSLLAGRQVACQAMNHRCHIIRGDADILRKEGIHLGTQQRDDRKVVEEKKENDRKASCSWK